MRAAIEKIWIRSGKAKEEKKCEKKFSATDKKGTVVKDMNKITNFFIIMQIRRKRTV